MSGNKRPRGNKGKGTGASSSRTSTPTWGTSKHLCEVRTEWQQILYREKILHNKDPYCYERLVDPDWESYGVLEPFKKWGWMAALRPINMKLYNEEDCSLVYDEAVREWIASLVKVEGDNPPFSTTLTGISNGKQVTLHMNAFNILAGDANEFDSGVLIPEAQYTYPNEFLLFENGPNTDRWHTMINDLFKVRGDIRTYKLLREDLVPLARALSMIINFNVLPRKSDLVAIRNYEVPLLHALMTGTPVLSLRHIMMLNIWASRDNRDRAASVPYVRFLSAMLKEADAIPGRIKGKHEKIKAVKVKVRGLHFYKKDDSFLMVDGPKYMEYRFRAADDDSDGDNNAHDGDGLDGNQEAHEAEHMDVDQGQSRGQDRGHADHAWGRSQVEQQIWDRHDRHFDLMQDAQRAQFWMQEYYRQQDWEQSERVRHYHDLMADRPVQPEYTPIDYTRLLRPHEVTSPDRFVAPPYPGIPPPMFYRSPPPPSTTEGGSGQSSTQASGSPWDMAPLAQGLYESLFSYPPPDSQ